MKKVLDKKLVHRFVDLIDEISDSQTDQLTFSFSSETPFNRGHCSEVLEHDVNSVDLSRLRKSAPFLLIHNINKPIGRVVSILKP